jgi:methylase of polypeptide subunit release factors
VEPVRAVPPPRRPEPPRVESRQAALELARLLRLAGYEAGSIQQRLATADELLARSPELPAYLRRLGDADELAVLVRLLLLGVPVSRTRFDALVGAELRTRLEAAGLLVEHDRLIHGAARLVPHDELLIASDHAATAEGHPDHVPGVHRPSVALAHLTVRGTGERALDVGTGNGIQAILLAAHAAHVTATDVNPRALAYTTFNGALNGASNIETRRGSFFEPVEGERFDLVVVNPPYVISPEHAYLFRDAGMRGDEVSEQVARAAPAALAAGGFASILVSWALDTDDPGGRPRSWLRGSGCDGFLLHTSTDDPLETAALWNRDLLDEPEAYAAALDRWLDYYRELAIDQIGYACLVLRKRADGRDGELKAQPLPHAGLRSASHHLRRLFEARDRLAAIGTDDALLARRLRVVDDTVVEREARYAEGRWRDGALTLRLDSGLPFTAELDADTARLIRALDGSKTLGETLAEAVDDTDSRRAGAALARQMLEVGFLELAD